MLTVKNIKWIKELTKDGITYKWFVSLKKNDSRVFINYENGKTVVKEYSKDRLPKTVQKFLEDKQRKEYENDEKLGFVSYVYC